MPQNAYRKSCQSAWRSASALYRGIKPQEGTGAPRAPLTCHCEERSDVAISQYTVGSWGSLRRKRSCLPEIATAPLGPRNDKLGGVCHFDGGLYGLQVHRREGHAPPLQRTVGGLRIFHSSFFSLQYSFHIRPSPTTPLSTLNFLRPAGGYPRTGISSNPGRAPIPRRGSDCSRPDCAPRPPRASARRPAAGSARPTERNTSRFP